MKRQFAFVVFSLVFLFGFSFATDLATCQDVTVSNDEYVVTAAWLDNDSTCFSISADNITFDCQGATLNYTGGVGAHNTGIRVSGWNVTIQNCIIQGWGNNDQHAIYVVGTAGVLANNCTLNASDDAFCVDSATEVYLNNSFVGYSVNGVYVEDGANATILNTEFYENTNTGIYALDDAADILVDNCTVDGTTKGAYGIWVRSPYSTIKNSLVTSVTQICIRFEDTSYIYNNVLTYCNYDGGAAERRGGIGTSQSAGGHFAQIYNNRVMHTRGWAYADMQSFATNDTFHSNYAYNITDHSGPRKGIGYYFYRSPGLIAYNNTAENVTGTGMYVEACDSSSFYNNSLWDIGEYGLDFNMGSENTTIYDNLIWDIGDTGIDIFGNTNLTVYDNLVHNCPQGISIIYSDELTLRGNTIHTSSISGIDLVSSDLAHLEDNILYANTLEFSVFNDGGIAPTFDYTMVDTIFRNPAGSTTDAYTVLSIQDEVVLNEWYSIDWTATPTPLPGLSSFRNKFVEINNVTADPVSISQLVWSWTAAEVSGYDESSFELWENDNGAWTNMGAVLSTAAHTLTVASMDPASDYGILENTGGSTNGGGSDPDYCNSDKDCPECYVCGNYGDCYLPEGSCAVDADCEGYGSELYASDYTDFSDTIKDALGGQQEYWDETPYDNCADKTIERENEYNSKLRDLSQNCNEKAEAQEKDYAEKLEILLKDCQDERYDEDFNPQEIPTGASSDCANLQEALRKWHEAELKALEEDCYSSASLLEAEYHAHLRDLGCYGWIDNKYDEYGYNNNGYKEDFGSGEQYTTDGRAYYDSKPPEDDSYTAEDAESLFFACIDCECVLVECFVDLDCGPGCECEGYACICEEEPQEPPPYRECWVDYDCPSNEYCDDGFCREIPEAEPEEEPEETGEGEIAIIEEETSEGEPPLPEPEEIAKDVIPLVGGSEEGGEVSETWASVNEWGWLLFLLIVIGAAIYIFFINKTRKGGKGKRK